MFDVQIPQRPTSVQSAQVKLIRMDLFERLQQEHCLHINEGQLEVVGEGS